MIGPQIAQTSAQMKSDQAQRSKGRRVLTGSTEMKSEVRPVLPSVFIVFILSKLFCSLLPSLRLSAFA
jgi:hypothetical protein